MKDIKFDVPATEYKEKPVRESKSKSKFSAFFSEQKYLILAIISFITMIAGKIWSMTIKSGKISIRELTVQILIYAMFYYLVFYFMTGQGRQKGKQTPVYLEVRTTYDDIHEKMRSLGLVVFLQGFCRWKRDSVISEMRQAIILDSSITYDDYITKWQGKPRRVVKRSKDLDKQTKRCIIEANAFKTPKLTASMLWEKTTFNEQVVWLTKSGEKKLGSRRIEKAIRVLLLASVSVSVIFDNVTHFDWTILIDAFICLLSAFFGYLDGFTAYAVTETTAYATRISLLSEAYDWAVEQKAKEKAE